MEVFSPLCIFSFFVFLFMTNPSSITTASFSTTPQPSPLPPPRPISKSPLRPSIAVVVGVITTMFSITFLLLLYAKHCRRRVGNGYNDGGGTGFRLADNNERKNSGIDRTIIESLPVFRFGSLSGQKDGLECAVCLNQFDSVEVLRLLPKCKHAFHVECVDTWLDAHSTCPLCRYRVDPEDIFLVDDSKIRQQELNQVQGVPEEEVEVEVSVRRVSGRHSSAGERGTGFLQISVDSAAVTGVGGGHRRSLDIPNKKKKKKKKKKNEEAATPVVVAAAGTAVGCLDRHRKDGLLLAEATEAERRSVERRLEHRIIISASASGRDGPHHRWSDVQPSDLLYLRSEMIISDSHRFSGVMGSRPSITRQQYNNNNNNNNIYYNKGIINEGNNGWWQRWWWRRGNGRNVINTRSVSEITGLSRFRGSNEEEVAGAVESRWLAWRSTQTLPAAIVVSGRPSTASSSVV